VREELIRTFAERFEEIMRPRFLQESVCVLTTDGETRTEDLPDFDCLIEWVGNLFRNLGIEPRYSDGVLELMNCPWVDEARGNPVFCLICRTMVIRSSTWSSTATQVDHRTSIASGGESCRFIFHVRSGRQDRKEM